MALAICFASLYVVLSFIPLFPIMGLSGASISAVAVMAPITGMILGPYLGLLSATLGGIASFLVGRSSLPSLVSTCTSTFCAGLLYTRKRKACIMTYSLLLFSFGLYPHVGPVWLFPLFIWFQVIGLLILLSPIHLFSLSDARKLFLSVFLISLISTLAGQIAGSLTFEAVYWPAIIKEVDAWKEIWRIVALVYPIERTIIAVCATIIQVPLLKVLKNLPGHVIPKEM